MRQIGKIGRRKVFSEVKNVNVKSRKNGSKLLDFLARRSDEAEGRREEETEGVTRRVTSYCHFMFYVRYFRYVRHVRYVRYKRYVRFAPFAPFVPFAF